MSPILEILSHIVKSLLADVEMLSPIGQILSLIWEILSLIWTILSPNFGEFWRIPATVIYLGEILSPTSSRIPPIVHVCVAQDVF